MPGPDVLSSLLSPSSHAVAATGLGCREAASPASRQPAPEPAPAPADLPRGAVPLPETPGEGRRLLRTSRL